MHRLLPILALERITAINLMPLKTTAYTIIANQLNFVHSRLFKQKLHYYNY